MRAFEKRVLSCFFLILFFTLSFLSNAQDVHAQANASTPCFTPIVSTDPAYAYDPAIPTSKNPQPGIDPSTGLPRQTGPSIPISRPASLLSTIHLQLPPLDNDTNDPDYDIRKIQNFAENCKAIEAYNPLAIVSSDAPGLSAFLYDTYSGSYDTDLSAGIGNFNGGVNALTGQPFRSGSSPALYTNDRLDAIYLNDKPLSYVSNYVLPIPPSQRLGYSGTDVVVASTQKRNQTLYDVAQAPSNMVDDFANYNDYTGYDDTAVYTEPPCYLGVQGLGSSGNPFNDDIAPFPNTINDPLPVYIQTLSQNSTLTPLPIKNNLIPRVNVSKHVGCLDYIESTKGYGTSAKYKLPANIAGVGNVTLNAAYGEGDLNEGISFPAEYDQSNDSYSLYTRSTTIPVTRYMYDPLSYDLDTSSTDVQLLYSLDTLSPPRQGFTNVPIEDQVISQIQKTGVLTLQIGSTTTANNVVNIPMTNCVLLEGSGPIKVVFMRGRSKNMQIRDFINDNIGYIQSVFNTFEPYKSYFNQFSFYADLNNYDDDSFPKVKIAASSFAFDKNTPATIASQTNCTPKTMGADASQYIFFSDIAGAYPGYSFFANNFTFLNTGISSSVMPQVIAHEVSHAFAKLRDEYIVSLKGNLSDVFNVQNYGSTVLSTENCSSQPAWDYRNAIDNRIYGGTSYIGCAFITSKVSQHPDKYYRPSDISIMNLLGTPNSDSAKFNVISCGYLVSALLREPLDQAHAQKHWPSIDQSGNPLVPKNAGGNPIGCSGINNVITSGPPAANTTKPTITSVNQ